ncbi:MAG: phage tail tape measure protein [Acidaminococcaceae bacterium]|nr:phage tail tape measure protein [Acidaminococcaceae bacterium]
MVKTFAFTFSINGLVSPGFTGSMNTARNGLLKLRQQGKDLNGQLKELDAALYKNEIDFEGYSDKANKVKNQLKALELQQTKLNGVLTAKNNLKSAAADLGAFSIGVYAASRPIVGMINTAADFEAGMSKVQAITRANSEEVGLLTKQAKELGRTTKFTARQSADAMSYLGMAGWQTKEIMAGMPGLLNLAAAGNTDLARTADIVSDDLTAFGLGADKAKHMADVFAYTVTRTNTTVEMLGETMKYGAPVAHAFGVSMEETAALAGLMANSGIKASQAGTALRSGFLRLAGPPKQASKAMEALGMDMSEMSKQQAEAQAAMKALGVQMSDTNGPRKMSAIITELRTKMQGLSKEERLATVGAIFGKNAATGWLAVLDSAPDKFDQLVNEMDKCDGEAERMANTMNSNARGAMVRLQSALESTAIEIGGVFLPMLADAGDKLAGMASGVAQVASEHPGLIKGIGLVATTMVAAVGAFKVARVVYAAYRVVAATLGFIQLSNAAATATATAATVAGTTATAAATAGTWAFNAALLANPIGLVVVGIAGLIAAGYALYKNWDTVSTGLVNGWNWIKDTAYNFLADLPNKAGYAVGYVVGWFMQLPGRLLGIIGSLGQVGASFISQAKEWGQQGVSGLIDSFLSLPGKLTGIISSAWESAKSAFSRGLNASGANGPKVAANAKGGIYNKGAFLTTFAEESPEAAIPIDGSKRAQNLWVRTGMMLGLIQKPQRQQGREAAPVIHLPGNTFNVPGFDGNTGQQLHPNIINVPDSRRLETGGGLQGTDGVPDTQRPMSPATIFSPIVRPIVSVWEKITAAKKEQSKPSQVQVSSFAPPVNINEASPVINAASQLIHTPVTSPINNIVATEAPPVNMTMGAMAATPDFESQAVNPVYRPLVNVTAEAPKGDTARNIRSLISVPSSALQTAAGNIPAASPAAPSFLRQNTESVFSKITESFRTISETNTSADSTIHIQFAPVYNISAGADASDARSMADKITEMSMAKLREMLNQLAHEQRRVRLE